MSDTSTVPGANVSAIQKSAARVFSICPGSTRCRIITPRRRRPFSSISNAPVCSTIRFMALFAAAG